MTWWIRGYLLFAAVQGLGIGFTGLLVPSEMQIPLRITPLNARFVAALYVAGGVGVLWAAVRARTRAEARLFVLAFALATTLILMVTLLHWSDFMADPLPHRPVWLFDYIADPILGALVIVLGRLWPPGSPTRHSWSAPLYVVAAVFAVLGVGLLVVPNALAATWPWSLPPVLGQVYGAFFITFGVGAFLAARESELHAVMAFIASTVVLCALVLAASALHLDRFKPEPVTYLWFAAFSVLTLALIATGMAPRWRAATA
jgi:hypothetical protein